MTPKAFILVKTQRRSCDSKQLTYCMLRFCLIIGMPSLTLFPDCFKCNTKIYSSKNMCQFFEGLFVLYNTTTFYNIYENNRVHTLFCL